MPLRSAPLPAAIRAVLALAGLAVGLLAGAWPPATACFAAVAALAIAETRAARSAEARGRAEAERAPPTGVGNWRRLHERLHAATAADPRRFALLTLDVDSFK